MLRTAPNVETTKVMVHRDPTDGSTAEMPVYVARPANPPGAGQRRPGLLVMQEIFGVNSHIQETTERFAANGYVAVAPDIFYRSGHWLTFGYDQVAEARPIVGIIDEEMLVGDMRAALEFLAAQPDVDPDRIGVVGYCYGGRAAFLSAARLGDLVRAAAIYYGGGIVSNQPGYAPLNRAPEIKCPVIAFYGALDKHIPREYVERLDGALEAAGVNRKVYYYPEGDHGFFCDHRASFHPRVAQDAWHRTLHFFGTHLGPIPSVEWQ